MNWLIRTPIATHFIALLVLGFSVDGVFSNGIEGNGTGARSMGMAGASLTNEQDALSAMGQDPATLTSFIRPELDLSAAGVQATGDFRTSQHQTAVLSNASGIIPAIAFVAPLSPEWGFGVSIIPEDTDSANWNFRDPNGGIDGQTSYGLQDHQSQIVNVRAALGIAYRVTDHLSLGASFGAEYTRNELNSPYTFQNQPTLAGFKTLLDMKTDGLGVNADLAAHWKLNENMAVAMSYRSPTNFNTEGSAQGDVTTQLRSLGLVGMPGQYRYDANIATALPQTIALGASWKVTDRLRLAGQVEWINWSRAFDTLNVKLSNGTNQAINGLLGSTGLEDDVALHWQDRFVYRAGAEYDLTGSLTMRAGYSYGKSPVPSSTLLPQTAAIFEQTVAAGLGYKHGPYRVDLAWQYDLPTSTQASASAITGSEYKNSSIENLSANWLALTVGVQF